MKTIKTGTKKQATADRREQKKQDQERTRAAISNMFGGSMDQLKNLKIKEQGVVEGEHDAEFIGHEDSYYRMVNFAHREMRKGKSLEDVIKYLVDNDYLGFMEVGTFIKQMRGEKWNESVEKGSLNEFAPSDDGDKGDDGFSEETLKHLAAQWYQGDEDPKVEKVLAMAGWEIGQDEGYEDEPGVFVVQSGDINGNSYISWPAEELQGLTEHIVKHGSGYRLLSHKGKNLGTFKTKAQAAKHEGEVEYFKSHPKEDVTEAEVSEEMIRDRLSQQLKDFFNKSTPKDLSERPDDRAIQKKIENKGQRWPDDSNSLSKRYDDRDIELMNPKEPWKDRKIATKIKPSITKTTVDRLDRDTTVPNFLKKEVEETKKKAVPSNKRSPGAYATDKHIANQKKQHAEWDRKQEEFYKRYPEYDNRNKK
jgi:hypothetical protein